MRMIGAILISICPIMIAYYYSKKLNTTKRALGEIINLLDFFMSEIKYQKRDLKETLKEASNKEIFSELLFLQSIISKMDKKPFPKAWEESIDSWETPIENDDKDLIKSMSNILGAMEAQGQISALSHLREQLKKSYERADNICLTKGKTSKTLGVLLSLGVFIIAI